MKIRGDLNARVQVASQAYWQRDLTVLELRIFPYLQYLAMNNATIDIRRLTSEERECIDWLDDHGYLQAPSHQPVVFTNREFYDFVCEVLWYAYADPGLGEGPQ